MISFCERDFILSIIYSKKPLEAIPPHYIKRLYFRMTLFPTPSHSFAVELRCSLSVDKAIMSEITKLNTSDIGLALNWTNSAFYIMAVIDGILIAIGK